MEVVRKTATITPTGSETDFPGTFEVILSAPTKDRDGDTLLPEEWKQPLPEHITFDIDHGMSVATTVGSGTPSIDAKTGNLIVRGTYSSLDRAQEVRTLVNEGHIRTTSVAFMNEPATVKNGKKVNQRELLNGAFVAVPSNREAVITNSKGYNEDQPRDENGRFASVESAAADAMGRAQTGLLTPDKYTNSDAIKANDAANFISEYVSQAPNVESETELRMAQAQFNVGAYASETGQTDAANSHYDRGMSHLNNARAKGDEDIDFYSEMESVIQYANDKLPDSYPNKKAFDGEIVLKFNEDQPRDENGRFALAELDAPAAQEAHSYVFEAADQLRTLADKYNGTKSLDDYSTKSSSDSTNIDSDVSEEAKSAEEVLKAAAHIAAAIEADSAEDADSVSLKAHAMNIIVEALASEN